jgi:hypothetical protein
MDEQLMGDGWVMEGRWMGKDGCAMDGQRWMRNGCAMSERWVNDGLMVRWMCDGSAIHDGDKAKQITYLCRDLHHADQLEEFLSLQAGALSITGGGLKMKKRHETSYLCLRT